MFLAAENKDSGTASWVPILARYPGASHLTYWALVSSPVNWGKHCCLLLGCQSSITFFP